MAKKTATNTERTSSSVASIAGRLLNGTSLIQAEHWLRGIAMNDMSCDDHDKANALALLGALNAMRSLAGSVLTQRG